MKRLTTLIVFGIFCAGEAWAGGGRSDWCFGLIYPVLLLVFMLRSNVVAVFHPAPAGGELGS